MPEQRWRDLLAEVGERSLLLALARRRRRTAQRHQRQRRWRRVMVVAREQPAHNELIISNIQTYNETVDKGCDCPATIDLSRSITNTNKLGLYMVLH